MAETKKLTVDVINASGNKVASVDLNSKIFGVKVNNHAIYEAVKLHNANKRQATAKTKKRSEVSGGGKKPWRQKGTGRARAGSTRSPIWVGGGTVFGPKGVQNFKLDQNRKAYDLALRSSLTLKVNKGLIVLDDMKAKKSKEIAKMMKSLKVKKGLIVVDKNSKELTLASRNINNIKLVDVAHLNVYDIMNANHLLITTKALKALEEVR
ncbi:MAG: 50S ribosomal protein L4 [Bacilli bacterium]|nr:50S ribosomal protein L4 [Bacilli bacterium]